MAFQLDIPGSFSVAPDEGHALWWAADEDKMRGRHGSLTRAEMLVPLLMARLDG